MFEKNLTEILSIIQNSKLHPNQVKNIIDRLKMITVEYNQLTEQNERYKLKHAGITGQYESTFERIVAILELMGFTADELTISINDEFYSWLLKNAPEKYQGKLMNYYLLECLRTSYQICSIVDNELTWSTVRDCMLKTDEHIEKSVKKDYESKMFELIEGIQDNETKRKLFLEFLNK